MYFASMCQLDNFQTLTLNNLTNLFRFDKFNNKPIEADPFRTYLQLLPWSIILKIIPAEAR